MYVCVCVYERENMNMNIHIIKGKQKTSKFHNSSVYQIRCPYGSDMSTGHTGRRFKIRSHLFDVNK